MQREVFFVGVIVFNALFIVKFSKQFVILSCKAGQIYSETEKQKGIYSRAMKIAEIRITEAILFKLGLFRLVNFNAREYNSVALPKSR